MLSEIRTGPVISADAGINPARADKQGALVIQNLHSRLHEANYRGSLFTFGVTNTALVNANAVATGVTATAQPVLGLWNPATSLVNLVVHKAHIITSTVANTAVSPGGFVWLVASGQSAISTGSNPFNCKTLLQAGSSAKVFSCGTALTGLSGSLATVRGATIATINAAGPATAIHQSIPNMEELVDGAWIVPPGGVLAIMNQAATTTVSVNTGILWEEVPV